MVVADPLMTADQAPELAKFLAERLDVDYFTILQRGCARRAAGSSTSPAGSRRRWPPTSSTRPRRPATTGLDTRRDPVRDYPAGDVAANLVGFMGTDEAARRLRADLRRPARRHRRLGALRGRRRQPDPARRQHHRSSRSTARTCSTTIDLDLQWYTQRVLRQTVEDAAADSGFAVVMDTRDRRGPRAGRLPDVRRQRPAGRPPRRTCGSRALSDVYEPGSVEKVLTLSRAASTPARSPPRTRIAVPAELPRDGPRHRRLVRPRHDPADPGRRHRQVLQHRHRAGRRQVRARASCARYLDQVRPRRSAPTSASAARPQGILPDPSIWTGLTQDRIAFGQSLSVNAVQMAAAVNTIANGGVRVSPSLIQGTATTDDGIEVGTDTATTRRVVSAKAARQTTLMMERVVDPEDGVAPGARRSRATGSPARPAPPSGSAPSAAATTAPSPSPSPASPRPTTRASPSTSWSRTRATAAAAARSPARRSPRS